MHKIIKSAVGLCLLISMACGQMAMADAEARRKQFVENLGRDLSLTAKEGNGWTDLHSAAKHNSLEVAKELLAHGADVHAKNNKGRTPYSFAKNRGLTKVKKLLNNRQ